MQTERETTFFWDRLAVSLRSDKHCFDCSPMCSESFKDPEGKAAPGLGAHGVLMDIELFSWAGEEQVSKHIYSSNFSK